MNLTPELVEHYYRTRLDPFKVHHSKGSEWRARCPMHGGDNASTLKISADEGWFICFGCGVKGPSVRSFEMEMLRLELGHVPPNDAVSESISRILGVPLTERVYQTPVTAQNVKGWDRSRAQARYVYTDELGAELYSVWRFIDRQGKKATPPDHPCQCSPDAECEHEGGRIWGSQGVRRVLYRLPSVIQSSLVFVVEGEKNVDDLTRELSGHLKKTHGLRVGRLSLDSVGVTTNPGGATAWRGDYGFGKFFAGKVVIKLGDNDGPGRKHDADACRDIAPHAHKLFTLPLPVEEGGDISDYLKEHGVEKFVKLLPSAVPYEQPEAKVSLIKTNTLEERTILVKPSQLVKDSVMPGGDWLVPGLIQRGTRGMVIAAPKTGKSLLFLDLALCLANMQSFLCMKPYHRPVRVAVISREDGPAICRDRLYALGKHRGLSAYDIDRNLFVNTVEQSALFHIDNANNLKEMAEWLKMMEIEFTVIDVLNRLHSQGENTNDMTPVMLKFDELAALSGSQVCVIHHTNKGGGVKGNTAIEGWPDYIFKLETDSGDDALKTLTVRTKLSGSVAPRTLRYNQSDDKTRSEIQLLQNR